MAVPFTALPRAPAVPTRGWVVAALVALLPMFFQCFAYTIDAPPLYYLAKLWPVLCLPLTFYALLFLRLPHTLLYAVLLAYVLGLTPFMSTLQLGSSATEAISATNKVWSVSFFFAVSAVLHLLQPSRAQLAAALGILAGATFAAFWLLWLSVPVSWFHADPALSQVFYVENERGFRIVLPVGFAMWGLFHTARRFRAAPGPGRLALLLAGFATLVAIYKQRTAIAMALLVVLGLLSRLLGPRLRAAAVACAAAGVLGFAVLQASGVTGALGASLSIRQQSAALALDFLRDDPVRWLLGAGSTTLFSATTLQDILGSRQFYLADIGWLGVVFEYGALGAALLAWFDLTGWNEAVGAGRSGDVAMQALGDYALYLLLVSAVYSVVYIPGEMATITALACYAKGKTA